MGVLPYQYLIFEWSMVFTTGILVSLRVFVQTRLSRTFRTRSKAVQIALEGFVIFAWLSFLSQAAMDTVVAINHGLDSDVGNIAPGKTFNQQHQVVLKITFVENTLYMDCMYSIKCHMLLFYWTSLITSAQSMKRTFRCLQFAAVFVVCAWVMEVFLLLLFCQPISRNWSLDENDVCAALSNKVVYGFIYGPHLASDLMVYFLPIPVLKSIRFTQTRKKVFAFISFGFGFLCVSFAAAQIITNIFPDVEITTNYMFTVMEQTWAILVVCVPAFKLFIRGWQGKRKQSIVINSINRNKQQTGATRDLDRDLTSTRSQRSQDPVALKPIRLDRDAGDAV